MLTTVRERSLNERIKSVKSISFTYKSSSELTFLLEDFRLMCNDAVRIALVHKPKSRFDLIQLAYPRLKEYGLHTHYILSACEVAFSIHGNGKRKKAPYIRKAFLKLDNQSYLLNHLLLRVPTSPRRFIFLTLKGSDYHLSFLNDASLKKGSATITERTVSIPFSKDTRVIETVGHMGMDVNERNVTVSASDGYEHKFAELDKVAEIKERYRAIRAKIGITTRKDNRISKKALREVRDAGEEPDCSNRS